MEARIGGQMTTRYTKDWAARIALVSCIVFSLAGCATTEGYERILRSFVGQSEQTLVRSWGAPDGAYESSGTKFLTYRRRAQVMVPGVPPTYQTTYIGNTAYTQPVGGTSPFMVNKSCITTFEVVGGVVTSWRWEGNACKAKE